MLQNSFLITTAILITALVLLYFTNQQRQDTKQSTNNLKHFQFTIPLALFLKYLSMLVQE